MNFARFLQTITLTITLLLLQKIGAGQQVQLKGTIYDRTARYGIPGVSVLSTSGAGTTTDSLGNYSIKLAPADSISFSYLGKGTQKFPVKDIPPLQPFDMSLQIDAETLPAVTVRQKNYRLDSLQNREEYRKIFDYEPDYLSNQGAGFGIGLSLSALLSAKKIRRMEALRKRLEQQERDKYVDYRFNKSLVRKITGFEEPALDTFMRYYRPDYETIRSFETQYEYYKYIKRWAQFFSDTWLKKHALKPKEEDSQ